MMTRIVKNLFIVVILACVAYQVQHIGLLLLEEDNECCPCMQLKMFHVALDKSSCCDCPNGFHLTFFFKDFIIESVFDLSWIIVALIAIGVVFYGLFIFVSYSTRSPMHFVNMFLFVLIVFYMSFNEKDGGITKLIGTDTLYSVCNFRCSMYDSKKTSITCYSRCLDTYMNGDYIRLVDSSRETLANVGNTISGVKEYSDSVSEYAQTQYNGMMTGVTYYVKEYVDFVSGTSQTLYNGIITVFTSMYETVINVIFYD